MKIDIKLLFILFTLFLLNSCSNPSILNYDNTNLNLQIAQKRIQVPSTQIKSNKENFSFLFLEQKLLRLR